MRLYIFLAAILLLQHSSVAFSDIDVAKTGATAKLLSMYSISGLKLAVDRDATAKPAFKNCIQRIDDFVLAPIIEKFLRKTLRADELNGMNKFNGSKLGERYALYTMEIFYKRHGFPIAKPVQFNQTEISAINRFAMSAIGQKYMWITDERNTELAVITVPASKKLTQSCRVGL